VSKVSNENKQETTEWESEKVNTAAVAKGLATARKPRAASFTVNNDPGIIEATARKLQAEAEYAELRYITAAEEYALGSASDIDNRIYNFIGPVTTDSVIHCQSFLSRWDRMYPGLDMTIILNSPGGRADQGMALFDQIQELKRRDHEFTIHARGWAASMAGILLQAASPGKRLMGEEAFMLVHKPSAELGGSIDDIEDYVKYMEMQTGRILDIYARGCEYAAEQGTATKPLTKAQIGRKWSRTDWWIPSDQALESGLIDEVR
jgi:ATP-dependent protease ClpP protease subunit